MKVTKATLADKISDILSTTPATIDPEEVEDETTAKVAGDPLEESGEDDDENLLSSFRKQNIDLLADVDERYAGKKSSRKKLWEYYSDSSSQLQDKDNSDTEVESESSESVESENGDDDVDEADESEDQEVEELDSNAEDEEREENFKHLEESDLSSQVKKGLCVRHQMTIWENLLEMRIQLQKCLIAANKMPKHDKHEELKKQSGEQFSTKVSETKQNMFSLLDKMMDLQKLVLKKYPETKSLESKKRKEESEEEILSDTNDERLEDVEEQVPRKKRKVIAEYETEIKHRDDVYKPYRNDVIQKWHEKTRLTVSKSTAPAHTLIDHIEHTLGDRAKLIKRTQFKRSDYTILCEESDDKEDNELTEVYDSEIFDDDDFYHQLLRELIEVKSADLTDPVQLGRQWMQLQNLRRKMKRKIDTRATKGRKIRYAVHSKLVNFMAPIEENPWTDEAKTELYSSLFGKKQVTV